VTDDINADEQVEIRADAIGVLYGACEWYLTPARWARVISILDALATAAGSGPELGRQAIKSTTMQLEDAGPQR
jgi:hypothetical protein